MNPTPDKSKYPFFEANQVLTNEHLNDAINYLDEQERLTRANLIGIGIVCGFEINVDEAKSTITVTKGCGISSEGYLFVQADNITLGRYKKDYTLPVEKDDKLYEPFLTTDTNDSSKKIQIDLWEIVPDNEANKVGSDLLTASVLNEKVVLLFLELKKEGLRSCTPNNCDDKGKAVTSTIKYLLISKTQFDKIQSESGQVNPITTLSAQLNLSDIRLPRYNVPSSELISLNELLSAFLDVFSIGKLVTNVKKALNEAYNAFFPILEASYPTNPFDDSITTFDFLEKTPVTTEQVKFLQYYYDFFDDLIKAYDEFRQQGLELLCACCPSEELFPRHLILGRLWQSNNTINIDSITYRQHFLASAALSNCKQRTQDVVQLFQRLVEMVNCFTNNPPLSPASNSSDSSIDEQIRITPSQLNNNPLSNKAIPYYYQQNGNPALYQLWNAEKTRKNQATHNLSYHFDKYQPPPPVPDFVTDPLRYDLEPYNFLRIEGHLGKDYQSVLKTLLTLKDNNRLPIDIIALRAGAFDESITIGLSKESCRFEDLEMLYDVIREQILCTLSKVLRYFYNFPIPTISTHVSRVSVSSIPVESQFLIINQYAPDFLVKPETLGWLFEDFITQQGNMSEFQGHWIQTFLGDFIKDYYYLIFLEFFYYLVELYNSLSADFININFNKIEETYNKLFEIIDSIKELQKTVINIKAEINFSELLTSHEADELLELLNICQLNALKAIQEEYVKRVKTLKRKQFLGNFLAEHSGIQHKAGVPLGGTFILVYHQNSQQIDKQVFTGAIERLRLQNKQLKNFDPDLQILLNLGLESLATSVSSNVVKQLISNIDNAAVLLRLRNKQLSTFNPDFQILLDYFLFLKEWYFFNPSEQNSVERIIAETVNSLANGTVIADFYLPYLCRSTCTPVQFVLPRILPTFTTSIGCSELIGGIKKASITVTPKNGMPPYRIKIDGADYQLLTNPITLTVGEHRLVIQDANNSVSVPQIININEPLALNIKKAFKCEDLQKRTYKATIPIIGGTPPYSTSDQGAQINGSNYITAKIASDSVDIHIADSKGCPLTQNVNCGSFLNVKKFRSCSYRIWIQPSRGYKIYKVESLIKGTFNRQTFQIPGDILQIDVKDVNDINSFTKKLPDVIEKLNKAINDELNKSLKGTLNENPIKLTYKQDAHDPFEVLWIEHFIDDVFELSFNYQQDDMLLHITYCNKIQDDSALLSNNGTILSVKSTRHEILQHEIYCRVPAFNCSEDNQCTNAPQELCKKPLVKPDFSVKKIDTQYSFTIAKNMSADGITWIWDFFTPTAEPFYTGAEITVDWKPGSSVRLTAINKDGCFNWTQKDNISITEQ